MKGTTLYKALYILLVLLVSYSCGMVSQGGFDKRKHLKGWHFQKKKNISISSSESKNESKYKSHKKVNCKTVDFHHSKNPNDKDLKYKTLNILQDSNRHPNYSWRSIPDAKLKDDLSKYDKEIEYSNVVPQSKIDKKRAIPRVGKNSTEASKNIIRDTKDFGGVKWSNTLFVLIAFFFPLFFLGKKTRNIQLWAAKSKVTSQSLLVGLKIGLAGTAMGFGHMVQAPYSLNFLSGSVGVIGLSFGLWEYWKSQNQLTTTKRMTLLSAVNTSTTYGFFTFGGMLSNSFNFSNWSFARGVLDHEPTYLESTTTGSTFLTVSAILGISVLLIILLYLILILSCRVYCSGFETVAIILAISLGYLLIALYIFIILKITVKEERDKSWYIKKAFLFGLGALILFGLSSIFFFDYPEIKF